jgi:hypothetical protein
MSFFCHLEEMKKNNTPRRKRLKRASRLTRAKDWIRSYGGKDLVKGYAKWFGVDWLCALHELKLAGVSFIGEQEQRIVKAYQHRIEDKARRKRNALSNEVPPYESDGNFAFIAGYTSNGVPYGVPYKEEQAEDTDSDLPFPW